MFVYNPFRVWLLPQLFFILFQSTIINAQPLLSSELDINVYLGDNESAHSSIISLAAEEALQATDNLTGYIYGVRWALSDYFSFSNRYQEQLKKRRLLNHNYYTLSFNSAVQLKGEIFLKIEDMKYACSSKFVNVPKTYDHEPVTAQPNQHLQNSTYFWVYVCSITNILDRSESLTEDPFVQWNYSIVREQNKFGYKSNEKSRKIQRIKEVLFNSVFRTPNPTNRGDKVKQNIMVIGDWGFISEEKQKEKSWYPILDSLIQKVEADKTLIMILFVGDMGYDMQGDRYSIFLKYIEPITSRVVFMTSPGNHDYYYHKDTLELMAQTFLSPSSSQFFNYYYSFVLGDSLFISYSPLKQVFKVPEVEAQVFSMLQKDLAVLFTNENQSLFDKISKKYNLFVFSHYPVFCSKIQDLGTCQQNKDRLKQYLDLFKKLQMDVYIAGHLHYYERTSQICWTEVDSKFQIISNYSFFQENNYSYQVYSKNCPIYLVQGAAGNNYFLEEDGAITPTKVTKKIVYRTGFGVFTIFSDYYPEISSQISSFIQYTHYKIVERGKADVSDRVRKYLPLKQKSREKDIQSALLLKVYIIQGILILSGILLFLYGKDKIDNLGKAQRKKFSQHIEMVQEKYEATQTIKPSQSYDSRKSESNQK